MKRVILAGASALAVLTTLAAANAADLPRRRAEMPVKAPAYVPPFSWTGFYVGINGGGAWGKSKWSNAAGATTGNFDTSGGLVGGTVGYNVQMGQAVFGLEGDIDWSGIKGTATNSNCAVNACETKNDWLGTVRGRVGYAFGRMLPYVTGGLAVGNVKGTQAGIGSVSDTKAGWTVGAGVEAAIYGPLSLKLEYLYADLGKLNCGGTTCAVPTDIDFHTNIVRAGLNYRF